MTHPVFFFPPKDPGKVLIFSHAPEMGQPDARVIAEFQIANEREREELKQAMRLKRVKILPKS